MIKRGLLILGLLGFYSAACTGDNFSSLRKKMVEEQIIRRGVENEKVIEALLKVPRHEFVPFQYKNLAYSDSPLPIGYDQTISQPYIVALMTELLKLEGNEKILEIGTGSGYQAAILAELVKEVYTVEILEPLAETAKKKLKQLGYQNIKVKAGDGFLGWKEFAPFDAIIITCAPDEIPPKLFKQLKEGGRMVIPVGKRSQELKLVTKHKGEAKVVNIIPVRFVPMVRSKNN
jgi:protein-L-isoaspartate(D-aspartate) O-methyltransferase